MAALHDLLEAGLQVRLAQELPGLPFSTYTVSGDGFSFHLRLRDDGSVFDPDDQATVDRLLNPPELQEPQDLQESQEVKKPAAKRASRRKKAT